MNAHKLLACLALLVSTVVSAQSVAPTSSAAATQTVFGFADFGAESHLEEQFLAVPNAQQAGEQLKLITARPHMAGTPEDHDTADYIAHKFRAAGLITEIVPYRVWMNTPKKISVEAYAPDGHLLMRGPQREHVEGDAFQDNPRVVMPFSSSSGSGDVVGDVVYANYGRLEDFDQLAAQNIDLHGKIVLVRYGKNYRGVKVYIAEQRGAAAVLLYSDPQDDGSYKGETYPEGPWRPETSVQLGSVQYIFRYPGDPQTPGVASTLDLPNSARTPGRDNQPSIIAIPLSAADASPILAALKGSQVTDDWQGALPFRYHIGPGGVKVHVVSDQQYEVRTIWDVIGKIKGTEEPDAWVIAGNHRDAWVYGAVDPGSGTAAMLETVHGMGALLKQGWRPKRTIVFASWDAEEEGLIGSTEWVEQHEKDLTKAVAYFNMDIGVSGPEFSASAVPSLRRFVRELTRAVASPNGGSVYDVWKFNRNATPNLHHESNAPAQNDDEPRVIELGSGSDYTPFLQHAGVPSTDITSTGSYGVYHSVFDNYAWFIQNADPNFVYLEEMARIFGLEALRMADADVLPYDFAIYARSINSYLEAAQRKATELQLNPLEFVHAQSATARFTTAADKALALQLKPTGDLSALNQALRQTEAALLSDAGLPNRPWYKHTIYAPGEYTGYAAVVIPGVSEAISAKDRPRAVEQLLVLTQALNRAAATLEAVETTR